MIARLSQPVELAIDVRHILVDGKWYPRRLAWRERNPIRIVRIVAHGALRCLHLRLIQLQRRAF